MKLYGMAEIAAALGVNPRVLSVWKQRGKLPEPDAELAMGPAWTARRIEPWIEAQRAGMTDSAKGASDGSNA